MDKGVKGSMGKGGEWGYMSMPGAVPAPVPAKVAPIAKKAADVPAAVESAASSTEETKLINLYAAKIFATEKIMKYFGPIKSSGALIVWIGLHGYEPEDKLGMVSKSSVLPPTRTKAISAKIIPFDPKSAFDIEPRESKCQKVEPNGTEVPFKITPTMTGTFDVGASVELYGKAECMGDVITRTVDPITVTVGVGIPWQELWNAIWDAFMKFFKEFLAICFALLLFIFRKELKKIFSFEKES